MVCFPLVSLASSPGGSRSPAVLLALDLVALGEDMAAGNDMLGRSTIHVHILMFGVQLL